MTLRPFLPCLFALGLLLPAATRAADAPAAAPPINIEAEQSLEYDQQARTYTARGHAVVTRGTGTVAADTLTAYERDKAGGKKADKTAAQPGMLGGPMGGTGGNTEIWKFVAEGNVVVTSTPADATAPNAKVTKAYGDHGVYDIDSQRAVLTGGNLHLDSGDDRVTAKDSLEYLSATHEAIATGDAKAVRAPTANGTTGDKTGERVIQADTLHAFFTPADGDVAKPADTGNQQLDRIEGRGHARVTTATDKATANLVVYHPQQTTAVLTGDVKLTRAGSQLEGDRAEMDTKSGISRLLADPAGGGKARVRGLLVPGTPGMQAPGTDKAAVKPTTEPQP